MSAPPPKRDKFAALAAKQESSSSSDPATPKDPPAVAAAPKRDKFASLAAASSKESTPTAATTATTQTINPQPRRRDKFAAVQQQKTVADELQAKRAIRERCQQRDAVWNDLDQAEAAVVRVLQLAQQTATALVQQTTEQQDETQWLVLQQLQQDYQDGVVQDIHDRLAPHAEHVVAYQAPQHVHQLYLSRVEHRIAVSKRDLLQEWILADQETDDEATTMSQTNNDETSATATATAKRKREDEMNEV